MKVAILNDTHAGARGSSDAMIDYQNQFYDRIFFPYLIENNIDTILHLGDYFEHRRQINIKAINANRKHFLDKLRQHKITMDIIPGNHDVFYKNTNEINSLKELLGHYVNEVNIIMQPSVITYGDLDVGLVPWITADNEQQCLNFIANSKAQVLAGHFELVGFDMMRGVPCAHGMDPSILSRYELVLSGHFHTKSHLGNIHYLGSQMEFTWSDLNDPKYFHILDSETRQITPVRNPICLFEKIVYDGTSDTDYDAMDLAHLDRKYVRLVVQEKGDETQYNSFVDRINTRDIHELKIAENFNEFIGTNIIDDQVDVQSTEALLKSYIESIDTSLDKSKILQQMHELMNEAQMVEM